MAKAALSPLAALEKRLAAQAAETSASGTSGSDKELS